MSTSVSRLYVFGVLSAVALTVGFACAAPPTPKKAVVCDCGCKCDPCKCCDNAIARPRPVQVPEPKIVKQDAPKEPQSFEDALKVQIRAHPGHAHTHRALEVLNMEPGERRDRILKRMENHAKAHLELSGEAGKIDWSQIDWSRVFDFIMKLLQAILPLLMMASAETGVPLMDLLAMVSDHIGVPLDVFFLLLIT